MARAPEAFGTGTRGPSWLIQALAAAAAAAVIVQSAAYLSMDRRFAFLVERQWLTDDSVWYACFYLHVVGGIVCLGAAPFLLWNGTAGGRRRLHLAIGRVYAIAALGWVAPTGAYLAAFAKGGLAGKAGFALLVALFSWCSVCGIRAVRRGDLFMHVACMVRSYAMLLSAFAFRAVHRVVPSSMDEHTTYLVSIWSSLALSVLAGEVACRRMPLLRPRVRLPVTNP